MCNDSSSGQFISPNTVNSYGFRNILISSIVLLQAFAFTACVCVYLEIGRIPQCRVYVNLLVKVSYPQFFIFIRNTHYQQDKTKL